MATSLDTRLVPKVRDLINKYGRSATFVLKGSYTFNAVTRTGGTTGDSTVATKVTPPEPYEMNMINGDTVQSGDSRVFVSNYKDDGTIKFPSGIPLNSTVSIDGVIFSIQTTNAIYTGELIALYECQLRQ